MISWRKAKVNEDQDPQQPTFGWLIIILWLVDVMRSDHMLLTLAI